jgi:hypothetical protein
MPSRAATKYWTISLQVMDFHKCDGGILALVSTEFASRMIEDWC